LVRSSYHSERHVFPGLGRKEWEKKRVAEVGNFSEAI
jgi:hypothetical protein